MKDAILQVLSCAVLAGLLAGVLLGVWLLYQRNRSEEASVWATTAGALAMFVGTGAGFLYVEGVPSFPPLDSKEWLLYAAALAVPARIIDHVLHDTTWFRWLFRLIFVRVVLYLLLEPRIRIAWGPKLAIAYMWIFDLGVVGIWAALEQTTEKESPLFASFLLWLTTTTAAVLLLTSGTISTGSIMASVAGVSGAFFASSYLFPTRQVPLGGLPVFVLLYEGLLLYGHFYADLPLLTLILIGLAPAVVWPLTLLPLPDQTFGVRAYLLRLIPLILIILTAGVFHFETGSGKDQQIQNEGSSDSTDIYEDYGDPNNE